MLNPRLLLATLSPVVLLPLLPAMKGDPAQGQPVGAGPHAQTFQAQFGPEVGNWFEQVLEVPKFVPPPGARLMQVEVEICGRTIGAAEFQNLDETECILSFTVEAEVEMIPADPASPVEDFDLHIVAAGGPIPLGPGESGSEECDSGLVCSPVQVFTQREDLNFFLALPDDEMVVFDHSGVTHSQHIGCGVLDFHSTVDSSLFVTIRYVFERGGGTKPPVCMFGCDPLSLCVDGESVILLDASRSFDPEGEPLRYIWRTNCPDSVLSAPTSKTTLLTIDHGTGPCAIQCEVLLTVSDGVDESQCNDVLIVP